MTELQNNLWQKIDQFEIDESTSSFTFTDRLVRENKWSYEFAVRAIFEYKRFLFLICNSKSSQTPSDEVDQVWHLHLLYTQSYWIDLCKNTLDKSIHHGPTKGQEEQSNFKAAYQNTLTLYETVFKDVPPKDIWPSPNNRFKYINFTRVNTHKNWVIPKIKLFKI